MADQSHLVSGNMADQSLFVSGFYNAYQSLLMSGNMVGPTSQDSKFEPMRSEAESSAPFIVICVWLGCVEAYFTDCYINHKSVWLVKLILDQYSLIWKIR